MSDYTKFRTAIGGFNRADVANYIESSSQEHQKEVLSLRRQMHALEQEKNILEQKLQAVQQCISEPEEQKPAICSTEEELEAYRRAEATERMATERAEKLRAQMQQLCSKTSAEYAASFEKVQLAKAEMEKNLAQLQEAMQELEKTVAQTKDDLELVSISK